MSKIFKIVLIFTFHNSFAQTKTTFSYDLRGNRTVLQEKGSAPMPKVTATQTTINPSETVTLRASECTGGTITWSPGNVEGNELQVQPTATTTYKATCDVVGCNSNYSTIKITVVNCPASSPITITNTGSNVKYGQEFTLTATGCKTRDPDFEVRWSNGYKGVTLKVKQYQNTQTYTATCISPECPNLGTGNMTVNATLEVTIYCQYLMYTIADGDWSNPNVWSCNRLPSITEEVLIRHNVNVNTNGHALKIIDGGGTLNYVNNSYIQVVK